MPIKSLLAGLAACVPIMVQAALPIQHWVTPQGARVVYVESRQLPMLDIAVSFPAGSARDPAGTAGLARLTHGLLDQGAGGLDETEIAHRLADVGALMGGNLDRDRASLSLRTLSSVAERNQAIDTFLRVLQRPDFPESVLAREKQRLIAGIREAEADPGSVASKVFYRALYGDHPYARDPSGEPDTIKQIDRAALQAFYRTHYSAPNATIALIGDLGRDEATSIAERIAAGLSDAAPLAPLPKPGPAPGTQMRINHPASQSHVLLGAVGMARHDPDFFPLLVGNYVLGGGGFDSRLMREIRDKRGFAYSAYSYFLPLGVAGPFQLGLQTQARQADEARQVAIDTLRDFVVNGPDEAELKQARDNLIGGFPLRIDSNRKILDFLSVIGFYDLPLDYLDTWTKQVAAVGVEDVKRAFATRLDPATLVSVVVGPDAP